MSREQEQEQSLLEKVAAAFDRLRGTRSKTLRNRNSEAYKAMEEEEARLMEEAMRNGEMPDEPSFLQRLQRAAGSDIHMRRSGSQFGGDKRRRELDEKIREAGG